MTIRNTPKFEYNNAIIIYVDVDSANYAEIGAQSVANQPYYTYYDDIVLPTPQRRDIVRKVPVIEHGSVTI